MTTPEPVVSRATAPKPRAIAALVDSLRAEFDRGKTRSLEWRLEQLEGIRRFLKDREEAILEALASDLGKPRLEAHSTEVSFTLTEIAETKRSLKKWMSPDKVSSPLLVQPAKSFIHKDPLGVVLIIAPWNYPLGLVLGPLVGAVAAGNCVVIKPSEVAPKTSAVLAQYLAEYVDPSCVAVVEGGVQETTEILAQRFDHIFYTGNGTVGRIVMAAAAKHLTPVTLELGGKSPTIVDRSANLEVAVKRIAWGKFSNAGQTCVAPDYVLCHRDVYEGFLDRMADTVRNFYGADPQKSPDYGRIVNVRHHKRLVALLGSGRIVAGGQTDEADRYIAPTVLRDVSPDSPVMQDEIFGPILPVLAVDSIDDAVSFVNRRDKPLALYVYAEDSAVSEDVIRRTTSGGAAVNHAWMHLANHDLPFGGVGESGMGAYHGKASFDCFTHHRSVLVKPTSLDAPILYPPYDDTKKKIIKMLL
ncbi:MAG TPA: aldehyde dehydrogenase family protein [Polyangiaceae bacterium]|nr:aldehyde dehydrogenase family protein [Polyangiaceae bacterium]